MKKVILDNIKLKKFISANSTSKIFLTSTGEILKLYFPDFINFCKVVGIDLEKKINSADEYQCSNLIIKPNASVYTKDGMFCGFLMNRALGIDFNKYTDKLSYKESMNLNRYREIHSNLEKIVKDSPDIVIPDLASCNNIFINGNVPQLIDYDGFQVGNYPTMAISTSLGKQEQYCCEKYIKNNVLFTKNLDKKSLIILYFLDVFKINLNNIGLVDPYTKLPITLEDVFKSIYLDDYELYDKVLKIYNDNVDNEYLGESMEKISKDYIMTTVTMDFGLNIRRLVKKK